MWILVLDRVGHRSVRGRPLIWDAEFSTAGIVPARLGRVNVVFDQRR